MSQLVAWRTDYTDKCATLEERNQPYGRGIWLIYFAIPIFSDITLPMVIFHLRHNVVWNRDSQYLGGNSVFGEGGFEAMVVR